MRATAPRTDTEPDAYRHCTTLIQLPVAFWAGSNANAAPVPAPRPSTAPWYSTFLP